jgi:hypothetical protein
MESETSNYTQRWKEPKLATRIERRGRICRCIASPNDRDAPTVITQRYIIRPCKISHPAMVHAAATPFLTLHAASKTTTQRQERGNTTSKAIRSSNWREICYREIGTSTHTQPREYTPICPHDLSREGAVIQLWFYCLMK